MAEVVKTIEDVDRLFSQIIVNGEAHDSDRYVPPEPVQAPEPVVAPVEEPETQTPQPQETTQGEDVHAVELNNILHNFVDPVVTQALDDEVTARETADSGLSDRISDIEDLIPSSASSSNKLVDQASIGTVAEEVATQTVNGIIADLDVAEAGGNGKYIKAISESNGKISATEGTIDSSVSSGSENPVTGGAVNTAIESAVNALDVAEAGGNGKYIKAISEANGKISATEGTIDSSVTSGSGNPVSSDAVNTAIGAIETGVSDIEELIPEQASASNQLADKNFVNSSIASNTANFVGTFESVTELRAYTGTVTNNDYAFVRNTVVQYNSGDFPNVTTLNNYDKTLLTNGDYAWVVNSEDNTKFDLYRFDIVEQAWLLRATKIDKSLDVLNAVFNRYKATVSGSTVTWAYEYTLNNSSFTAEQWATINSGLTSTSISDAINALDVAQSGGNGKYIKAISETDGKISTTEGTIDSSVTSGSSNPVTGGAVYTGLDGKVDKVAGKGLSTNDFTDTLKDKLDGIEAGAQVNSVTGVKGDSETAYRTGNVNITKSNIGLGSVVDTGDSATPVSGGITKFTTGGAYTELAKKQDKLTFDTEPTAGSSNPVTSDGIKSAIDSAKDNISSLPTDSVLHYSFDDIPDYPDGTAVYFKKQNWVSNDNWRGESNVFTVVNGILTINSVATGYFFNNFSGSNLIIKFKIRTSTNTSVVPYVANTNAQTTNFPSVTCKANEITEATIYFNGSMASFGFTNIATGIKFELLEIYIGNGSYNTPIIDNSGNNNNATNNGGIAVHGVSGKGAYFLNGKSANCGVQNLTANFSISVWVKPDNNTGGLHGVIYSKTGQIVLRNGTSWGNFLMLFIYPEEGTYWDSNIGSLLTPNKWTHLVITREGTTVKVYRDGALSMTKTMGFSTISNNTNPLYLCYDWAANTRPQSLDDFQIFNRALSEQEVVALYLNKANTPKYYDLNNYDIDNADTTPIADSKNLVLSGGVYSALADKQPKTLSTPITVEGTQQTTVEGALGALAQASSSVEIGTVISTMGDVPIGFLNCGKSMIEKFVQNSSFPTNYDVHTLLQTADGTIYVGTNAHGIYKSTDGNTFTQLSGFPTSYTVYALLQTSEGTIYAGATLGANGYGIYKSTDGNTFTQLSGFPTSYPVYSLLQTADGTIYAGTRSHGIYKSTDGNTFTQLSGFPTSYTVYALLQTSEGTIYVGTHSYGIYKSIPFKELSKTTYADLYAVVGDRYKAKAGVTDNTKFAISLVGNDDLTYAVKT